MLAYQNAALSPEERTSDLLGRMNIDEKIGQLCKLDGFLSYEKVNSQFKIKQEFKDKVAQCPIGSMYGLIRADWWTDKGWDSGITPERMNEVVNLFQKYIIDNSRWGIPLYLAEEAGHGLMALGMTVFPTGLGLGSTWDAELMGKIGTVIGREARAAGVNSVYGPILDIPRDPRWSRVEENYSEDPYLTSVFGVEMVRGICASGIVPTLKHFAGHGSPEGGHNTWCSHVGPIELRNCQLRPFRDAIRAGAKSVMSAYNDVDGEPATGSYHLLTEILRGELGFNGFVVSDRGAIMQMVQNRLAGDQAEASARALLAGCDVDEGFLELHSVGLREALKRKIITELDLDRAVGRILKLKFESGIFEHPFMPEKTTLDCDFKKHHAVALEAARKSMTLLQNKNNILPLNNINSLAVIGPNADNVMNQLGDYTAPQKRDAVSTVLDGIKTIAAERDIDVNYAVGCRIRAKDRSGFQEAFKAAEVSDAVVMVLGGSSTQYGSGTERSETGAAVVSQILDSSESDKESGEGTDRGTFSLSGVQMELFHELRKCGKPVIVVLIQGRPLLINDFMDHADALLMGWYPGQFGGQAVAEVLFGMYNPAGRLPVSIPFHEGQIPVFYNTMNKRPLYVDIPSEARLSFGYGLSFTKFEYSELKIEKRTVSVRVKNVGDYAGDEVVQFYLTDMVASIQRPWKELCGFKRINLAQGESALVECELSDEVLGYYNQNLKFVVEPGKFEISVGGSLKSALQCEFLI